MVSSFRSAFMKQRIDGAEFGSITVDGHDIGHDVLIRLSGEIKKRKKKLSKAVFGTSHRISLEEAKYIFEKGTERLIIGSGHSGMMELSEDASAYFQKKKVRIDLLPTPEAVHLWNKVEGPIIGLFHVTC
jgi:hypothetical protein